MNKKLLIFIAAVLMIAPTAKAVFSHHVCDLLSCYPTWTTGEDQFDYEKDEKSGAVLFWKIAKDEKDVVVRTDDKGVKFTNEKADKAEAGISVPFIMRTKTKEKVIQEKQDKFVKDMHKPWGRSLRGFLYRHEVIYTTSFWLGMSFLAAKAVSKLYDHYGTQNEVHDFNEFEEDDEEQELQEKIEQHEQPIAATEDTAPIAS